MPNWSRQIKAKGNHVSKSFVKDKQLEKELLNEVMSKRSNNNSQTMVKFLLDSRVDPNIPNREHYNNRPLHYAAKLGNSKLMMLLLQAGADPMKTNCVGQTPLFVASRGMYSRHTRCVEVLLRANIKLLNKKDKAQESPLKQAIQASNVMTVKVLLANGADFAWERNLSLAYEYGKDGEEDSSPPAALLLAKSVRAMTCTTANTTTIRAVDQYFDNLESRKRARPRLLWDLIMRQRLFLPSHTIVKMIEAKLN